MGLFRAGVVVLSCAAGTCFDFTMTLGKARCCPGMHSRSWAQPGLEKQELQGGFRLYHRVALPQAFCPHTSGRGKVGGTMRSSS